MQSIMGMETSKIQFAIPNKRWSMEVINHWIIGTRFTVLFNGLDMEHCR